MFRLYHNLNTAVNSSIVTFIPTGTSDVYMLSLPAGIIYVNRLELRIGFHPYTFGPRAVYIDSIWTGNGVVLEDPGLVTDLQKEELTPSEYTLSQNFPNPFNPSTKINISLPEKSLVSLKIYDLLGKEVAELVNEELSAGKHSVEFNATALPSGMYFYNLKAGTFSETRKMTLLK